jgi:hypothetical protein
VELIPMLIALFFFVFRILNKQKKSQEEARKQAAEQAPPPAPQPQWQAPSFAPPAPQPRQPLHPTAAAPQAQHAEEGLGTHEHREEEAESGLRYTEGPSEPRAALAPDDAAYAIRTQRGASAMLTPGELRRAVLLTEILGKPRGRR